MSRITRALLALAVVLRVSSASVARADEPPPKEPEPEPEPTGVVEITVREPPRPAGAVTLTRAETRLLPGAFGDPFRAVESVPSVVPLASGVPYFYLRGAPPGNIGYL